jgi:putative ABC transport system permease protein
MKKEINVAKQPWLGFSRIIQITVDGIRYRLFRASVTVAVIAVAVAFLMNILSESLIKRSVAQSTRDRIRRMRLIHDWSARLTSPGNPESFLRELAHSKPDGAMYREVAGMTGFDEPTMQDFYAQSCQATAYLDFFNSLDYAKRRNLIHTAVGIGIFKRLQTENGMEQFTKGIGEIHSVRFVSSIDDLKTFLADWPALRKQVQTVLDARKQAVATIKTALAGRTIDQALAKADKGFGDTVRAAGFVFDPKTVAPIVAGQAQAELDISRIQDTMDSNACKQLIAQKANVLPADVNVIMMWRYLDSPRFAARYLERMQQENAKAVAYEQKIKSEPPVAEGTDDGETASKATTDQDKGTRLDVEGLTADRLVTLAKARVEEASLIRAERLTVGAGGGFMGLGERLAWLLFVSLLVCGIGIANAMLMTVTERFTEIATLKCLGALDGFIMIMFVLESCFLGLVGGIIGAILGALIGLSRMLAAFGLNFAGAIPATDIIVAIFASVVMGMLLAAFAAVLPSFKAARLAPMEAMRIE